MSAASPTGWAATWNKVSDWTDDRSWLLLTNTIHPIRHCLMSLRLVVTPTRRPFARTSLSERSVSMRLVSALRTVRLEIPRVHDYNSPERSPHVALGGGREHEEGGDNIQHGSRRHDF